MANSSRQNFTDRLTSNPDSSVRVGDLRTRIEDTRSEADSLQSQMGFSPTSMQLPGEDKPQDAGIRGTRMKEALDQEFFRAAEKGDDVAILAFLLAGFDPNMKRPRWRDTVLHIAATRDARDVIRVLVESGKCDYLLRDHHGHLASDIAFIYGSNPALARLLSIKEKQQAEAAGIKLTWRRQPDP